MDVFGSMPGLSYYIAKKFLLKFFSFGTLELIGAGEDFTKNSACAARRSRVSSLGYLHFDLFKKFSIRKEESVIENAFKR